MAPMQQEMETNTRKVFVGGISWDTNEDHLLKYFKDYGEVEEVIIIRDRATGRTRGFGFIVFSDPAVVKHVITEKHMIDGRMVDVKIAIPRDNLHALNKNHGSAYGSQGPNHKKKIFVGGLAPNVTKVELTKYFKQFGTIIDVVVVYDHNTQLSRGFGFVTYDSEDAVDRALLKTFHKLNGKRFDVKRANPKEVSPRPRVCSRVDELNHFTTRANSFQNGYNQGCSRIGMNFDPKMNPWIRGGSSFNSNIQYGWHLNPYYIGDLSGFNSVTNGGVNGNNGLVFDSLGHNIWGNLGLNHSSNSIGSNFCEPIENGDLSGIGNNNVNWGDPHHVPAQGATNCSIDNIANFGYRSIETNFGQGYSGYGRNDGSDGVNTFNQSTNGYANNIGDLATGGGSIYGNTIWSYRSFEHDGTSPFGYGLPNYPIDVTKKCSTSYLEN